jgi:heat shock protein HtpX
MRSTKRPLPSRNWLIVVLSSAGAAIVITSYLLAIAIGVACFSLPLLLLRNFDGSAAFSRLLLSLFGLVAGATILWSILPRRDHFEVQGIPIDLAQEPRLAAHIQFIATKLNEPMPSEVYLLGDANAFVTERGGFMGFGSRRILGIGLPLLQMLSVSQFHAVLGHEFAHYYGGDTRLGPWIYNTTRALARVYENLGNKSEMIKFLTRWMVVAVPYIVLMWVLRMYWMLFVRVTQVIALRQEYRCDELACHIAGSQPLIDGLQVIHHCSAAIEPFWNSEVLPIVSNGFQPQIADGFLRFMNAPQVAKATSEVVAREIAEGKTEPLDSHPTLRNRIERAQQCNIHIPANNREPGESEPPMLSAINGLDLLEGNLLKKFVPSLANLELTPTTWDTAARDVYVPMWRKEVENYVPYLEGQTLNALPALIQDPKPIADQIPHERGRFRNRDDRNAKAIDILSSALTLSMIDHGWKLVIQPGTFYLDSSDDQHDPFEMVANLKAGRLTNQQWDSFCTQKGIGEWALAGSGQTASGTSPALVSPSDS